MLNFKQLKLAYGSQVLINNATLQLYKGQKIGLVGANGAGKTTLFKLILGQHLAEGGEFYLSSNAIIAYVEQEIYEQQQTLTNYVLSVHPLIINNCNDLPEYYQLQPKAEKLLLDLGFSLFELNLPLSNFSGGWQMRANLAKALFIPSDLLLLDEPTNHLDIETVIWLEDWLKKYSGLALIISHDREFLDNVTTHTLAIKHQTLTLYSGNYSTFEATSYQQLLNLQQLHAKNLARLATLQSFVDRFRAKASKAKQAQSRLKMMEKLQVASALPKDIEYSIEFFTPHYNVNKLLTIENATIGYPNKVLLKNVCLDLFQTSKIGLLGKNGVGKSTLIKAFIDGSTLINGSLEINKKIKIGYFAQNMIDQLNINDTALGLFIYQHKDKSVAELRRYLGQYGFSGDKVNEKIGNFSGGEKARLTIANIILQRPNLLFLDEPTNHLDMQMRFELANAIQDFNGSVVIVSHDKFLLQSIVDEFYLINDLSLKPFKGNLDDYHQFLLADSKSSAIKSIKPIKASPPLAFNPVKLKSEINKLEEHLLRLTQKNTAYTKELLTINPNTSNKLEEFKQLSLKQEQIQQKINEYETKWLELHLQLDK